MNIKTVLKSSVAVAALFAVAAPAANAEIKNGNKNSLTVSGQVVRAIFHADDGVSDKVFQTGGDWYSSRVRWIASGKLSENVSAGAIIEMNIPTSNEPGNMTLGGQNTGGTDQSSDGGWDIRQEYIWVSHKKMGKLRLGNTDGAANGTAESDFAGTGFFARSEGHSIGAGLTFMNTATAGSATASTATIGNTRSNLDGNSRDDVLRYDSPKFGGASIALSTAAGGIQEVGLRYGGKFGAIKVKAAAGFTNFGADSSTSRNFIASGSVAFLHDSGLNASVAGAKLNYAGAASKSPGGNDNTGAGLATDTNFNGAEDPHFIYWSVGYNAKIFGVGGTGFNFLYGSYYDVLQLANHDDGEATTIGFQVVQNFSAIGATIGLQYKRLEYDSKSNTTANTFDDIDVIAMQTMFTF